MFILSLKNYAEYTVKHHKTRLNSYVCTALCSFNTLLGRSKLKVRMGSIIKKMIESYENSMGATTPKN